MDSGIEAPPASLSSDTELGGAVSTGEEGMASTGTFAGLRGEPVKPHEVQ